MNTETTRAARFYKKTVNATSSLVLAYWSKVSQIGMKSYYEIYLKLIIECPLQESSRQNKYSREMGSHKLKVYVKQIRTKAP